MRMSTPSNHLVCASQTGAKLDSNVLTDGGTGDTAALQAVLDQGPKFGRLHLIMDGAALVCGLTMRSNTTIECPNPVCGVAPQLVVTINRRDEHNVIWIS
jgi:hypothetical protein